MVCVVQCLAPGIKDENGFLGDRNNNCFHVLEMMN